MSLTALAAAFAQLCNDVGRIASALETLALIQGGDHAPALLGGDDHAPAAGRYQAAAVPSFDPASAFSGTAEQAAAAEAAKPKRTRRTKEQIAADEAAAAAAAATGNVPPAAPPAAFMAAVGGQPTAPMAAVPSPMAAAPNPTAPFAGFGAPASIAATLPQATASPLDAFEPQYSALTPDQQFAALLDVYVKAANVLSVRDAMHAALTPLGLAGAPISDPLDRSKPGAGYVALNNAQRWSVYRATALAVQAATNAVM